MGRLPALRGRGRRPSATLIVLIGGLAANCLVAGTVHADSYPGYYGVNAQQLFLQSSGSWAPQLSAMSSGGVQLVRTDARWADVEPSPPSGGYRSYDWSHYDALVQALAQHGLRWYPVLEYAPAWAGAAPGDQSPAASHESDFATYANVLAQRYGRGGSFWQAHPSLPQLPVTDYEIWNEENSTVFWPSQADAPERYADLYLLTRPAIRAVDSQARVVIGGLSLVDPPVVSDEVTFLGRMLVHRPDLRGQVDGVGLHPYQATLPYLYARLDRVRAAVNALLGASVPIEVTEVGWNTMATPEAERAGDLANLVTELPRSDCNVDRLLVYSWLGSESDSSNPEDWFGIWNGDGSAKPSGAAYTQAVLQMRGLSAQPAPTGVADLCPQAAAAEEAQGAAARVRGPSLSMRTLLGPRRRRLIVIARCPSGCSLTVSLMRKRAASLSPVARRSTRFSSRRWRITLRFPRGARHLQLRVVATGNGGGRTTRVRHIRVPSKSA